MQHTKFHDSNLKCLILHDTEFVPNIAALVELCGDIEFEPFESNSSILIRIK